MPPFPLISVHVAKAGGTSVAHMLKEAYGEGFFSTYRDNPADPLSQRVLDPCKYFSRREKMPIGINCVHGHFHPGKFDLTQDLVLFTLLRHPVDNILSIYFYWNTLKDRSDGLHDYFCHNNLTIMETAQLPLLRWLYSRTYFENFDMRRFDVIGRHEDRENILKKLSERIETPLNIFARENLTPESQERREALEDRALRNQLENLLVEDIRFYERHTR